MATGEAIERPQIESVVDRLAAHFTPVSAIARTTLVAMIGLPQALCEKVPLASTLALRMDASKSLVGSKTERVSTVALLRFQIKKSTTVYRSQFAVNQKKVMSHQRVISETAQRLRRSDDWSRRESDLNPARPRGPGDRR